MTLHRCLIACCAAVIFALGLAQSSAEAAPVAHRSTSSQGRASASAGAFTISKPAGTAANDLLLASIGYRPCSNSSNKNCTTSITAPAGWTLIRVIEQKGGGGTGGYGMRLGFWYKVATAGEPNNYTWAIGGTPSHNGAAGTISSFQNVDVSDPIVISAGQTTASSRDHDSPDLGILATGTMLLTTHASLSSAAWKEPTGMTKLLDWASETVPSDLGMSLVISYEQRENSGPTGTRRASYTSSGGKNPPAADTGATHAIALRPLQADPTISMLLNSNLIVGQNSSYTLTVGNNGPESISASNIKVVNTLPIGTSYNSSSGSGWSCSASGRVVTCTYSGAALVKNAFLPLLTIHLKVNSGTEWTNEAVVTSGTDGDNDTVNSRATYTWPPNTTTLSNCTSPAPTDPAASTIAPSAAMTDVNCFALRTNKDTEAITAITVNLSDNRGIDTLAITDASNNILGWVNFPPAAGSVTIPVANLTASTTSQKFKVRVEPISHTGMPSPPGALYSITAPVTAWTGPAAHTGSDTNSNALTIDNESPASITDGLANQGTQNYTLSWKTSASTDFATSSGSVVYRWLGNAAGSEVPLEGATPTKGDLDDTATVACVHSSNRATAVSIVDGRSGSSSCTTANLVNGQTYTYKVFQRDSRGNYDTGTVIGVPEISISDAQITEGDSGTKNLTFTVTRTPAINSVSKAAYSLTNGTAAGGASCSGGTDFINSSGAVEIASGQTSQQINVPICGDTAYEADETFTLTLSNPQNAKLGSQDAATGTIINDDVDPAGCFLDDFGGNDNVPPSGSWRTTTSSGSFGMPRLFGNRLRMTDNSANIATAVHLQRRFPGAGNKVIVEFDQFAYGGDGGDGIALTFSDAAVAPVAGAYGGSLGYAQKTGINGFAGGWLGVGFDEFGNFASASEGRDGGPGQKANAVTVRGSGSGTSGYKHHATSASPLSPAIWQSGNTARPGHRYRITIDHTDNVRAMVKVERSTNGGSSYSTVISEYDAKTKSGQAAVPDEWLLSFSAGTGDSNNIHEIDNLKVCAVKPIIADGPDHLRIRHDGDGVTCAPTTLTLEACADALCSSLYTDEVSGSLVASGGSTVNWPAGNPFVIRGGTTTVRAWVTTPGSVTWGTIGVSPDPAAPSQCVGSSPSSPCVFNAAEAGFLFDVPDHLAGEEQKVEIAAVKKADNSLKCVPAFGDQTKTLRFSCAYSDPASGTEKVALKYVDSAGGYSNLACGNRANGPGTGVSLRFGPDGKSGILLSYADVGRINLTAAYSGAGNEAGLAMTHSDDFVVAPARFRMTAADSPLIAGDNFAVTVSAVNTSGAATGNFGKESQAEGVVLEHNFIAPDGGNNPELAGTTKVVGNGLFNKGEATVGDISWGEVGRINLKLRLANRDGYLNSNIQPDGNLLERIFRPHRFTTKVTPGSGSFTYSGQPFKVTVTAQNSAEATTQNYVGDFAKNVRLKDRNQGDNKSDLVGGYVDSSDKLDNGAFAGGVARDVEVVYAFADKESAPLEAPISAPLLIQAVDDDTVSSEGFDQGNTPIRSGRLQLSNAVGSERLPLQVPVVVEYYNGKAWLVDGAVPSDLLAALPSAEVELRKADGALPLPASAPLSGSGNAELAVNKILTSGATSVTAVASSGGMGYLDFMLGVPKWLQYPWKNGADSSPTARVSFGLYGGNKRIIYRRERH